MPLTTYKLKGRSIATKSGRESCKVTTAACPCGELSTTTSCWVCRWLLQDARKDGGPQYAFRQRMHLSNFKTQFEKDTA